MADKKGSLFSRLTKIFRSGPIIRRKVKNYDQKSASTSLEVFRKAHSDVYNSTLSAYGAFDRMSRYSDFSEMEACIAGDTLIATPYGYTEIQELAKKYSPDETFVVYAYDHEKKQIVPALGKQARHTITDMSYKITFDSGKTLIATPDHRVMKRDGTYCQVQDLKAGDSMMPFYRRDLFSKDKDEKVSTGYRWIYTMDNENSTVKNGWVAEHRLIASWVANRKLNVGEVVHHKNFVKNDNRPENLQIMTEEDHKNYHAVVLNGKKWDKETNSEWIEKFKKSHSEFMKNNNPVRRHDITFSKILQECDTNGFNLYHVAKSLDCDFHMIALRLKENGFNSFTNFAKTYDSTWKNAGWDNKGTKNPRYDKSLSFQMVCDSYLKNMSLSELSKKLNTTEIKISKRIKENGFSGWTEFKKTFANHKVVSVEPYKVIDLYDLTVDGYKNYATDSIIVHNTPEIGSALDIYSEEAVSSDDKGNVLHIYSENTRIVEILEELFYDVLNVDFNLSMWVRNLVKYGDFFLFLDVSPEFGIINAYPISISEMEREEGFDSQDPSAVRFRWISHGNQTLENWQVAHFRLLGNDAFLPYGSSVLEAARRIWRQLILMEDAMLVYRVIRAPERRVFYIDVQNLPPDEIENYMEQAKTSLKRQPVVDKNTGKMDLRYNPYSVEEDFFLPVRGGESGTKIDTLAGGTNASAIEDVEYIQKKLFAALKIPRAYLGYDEETGAKATLAQEDIRFSRTVQKIQKVIISELLKIARIHLYCHGFEGDELGDFTLKLTNPSSVAQMQKLELIKTKFEIAGTAPEGVVDRSWIRKNIIGLTNDEMDLIKEGRIADKIEDSEVENAAADSAGDEVTDDSSGLGGSMGMDAGGDASGGSEPESSDAGGEENLFTGDVPKGQLLTAQKSSSRKEFDHEDAENDDYILDLSIDDEDAPESFEKKLNVFGGPIKASRKATGGPLKTAMPDFLKMTSVGSSGRGQDSMNDPFEKNFLKKANMQDSKQIDKPRISNNLSKMFNNMSKTININRKTILKEELLDEDLNGD